MADNIFLFGNFIKTFLLEYLILTNTINYIHFENIRWRTQQRRNPNLKEDTKLNTLDTLN